MFKIGHRGAAGLAPENTISSITKAIELNVDCIELDVQETRDEKLVIFHDKLLDRVTNATGHIKDYTYQQLRDNVLVNNQELIPLLSDVCGLLSKTNIILFPEIKVPKITYEVVELLLEKLETRKFVIGSFHHEVLVKAKTIEPTIKTVALFEGAPISIRSILHDSQCDYLGIGFESVNPNTIEEAHKLGIDVWAWTIDDLKEMKHAIKLGINGIVSNYPNLFDQI